MMLKCINMKKIKEIKPEPKKATVDDFIGVFDNFIPPGQCEEPFELIDVNPTLERILES